MTSLAVLERPSVPVAYLQILVELLAERGLDAAPLFAGIPNGSKLLAQPDARLSALQVLVIAGRAVELTNDPALGYSYGLRLRPTAHGFLGYATVSSATVREACDLVVRYGRVRGDHFRLDFVDRGEDALLVFGEKTRVPLPLMRMSIHESLLLGLARGLAALLGRELSELPGLEIWFDAPEPAYFRAWADRLPTIRFDTDVNAIRIPRSYLDLRPVLADPHASKQALSLCEHELETSRIDDEDVVDRVRAVLAGRSESGYPTLEAVAEQLAMSSRTLKRRLQQSGTTYLTLLNERRERDACSLLAETRLPVAEIAASLGYDPPNFTRAFASWTGLTPSQYREQARPASDTPSR